MQNNFDDNRNPASLSAEEFASLKMCVTEAENEESSSRMCLNILHRGHRDVAPALINQTYQTFRVYLYQQGSHV